MCNEFMQTGIFVTNLDTNGTLTNGWQKLLRWQKFGYARFPAHTLHPGRSQHNGIVFSVIELGQTGVDVATQIQNLQIRAARA
jgi:hypothetical protein